MGNGKPAGEAERSGPEQLPTGVPGLDRLLAGGLRRGGLHVVLGGPGAGKSVLAHQIGAHMIRAGGKVLYLTALVETHQMLLSQARTFRFFDPAFVPGSFYYASLYPALANGGLQGAREEISRLVAQHGPTLLVVDGVHALKAAADSPMDFQRFMHEMEAQAAVAGTTTLLLVHPPEGNLSSDPTFTIADAIFHMRSRMVRLRDVRMFSVAKLRGVAHVGGWHTFRITGDGVRVFPRVEALASGMEAHVVGTSPPDAPDEPLEVRIEGLDEMLGGGLDRHSVTLVVGTPGAGKTLFGLAFLAAGAEAGEPGLLIGYHETPETLIKKGEGVALPVRRGIEEGMIHLDWRSPSELLADEEVERLLALIEEHRIQRVVIDALEDLRSAVIPRSRELFVLASLANLLREKKVTTMVMHDLQRIVGVSFDMPMAELSATMDNALHLRAVEQKGQMLRMVAVLKVRARAHDHSLREFLITPEGMSVGKAFSKSEMVLTGLGLPR
ncbi:MAG TPA: ATPase domain-containing protein [Longimicrobiaceae bacterium]|nr:ATPase domain-containing protein [Longimicrobiaceae bacterium]